MKLLFQFGRILAVCFLGEVLAALLPLPIPAGVYGLLLMLAFLKLGLLRLDQVKEAGGFLTGILPLLFIPAAVGVMDLWTELDALLAPCVIAIVPVTLLVMAVSGRVTQHIEKRKGEDRRHDGAVFLRRCLGRCADHRGFWPGDRYQSKNEKDVV